jgi:hypothetical protein
MVLPTAETDEKALLQESLRQHRDDLLWKLDGLSEFDLRRPMTPTGTNLLGLVKHLAGIEYGYLGGVFGRPAPERLAWMDDGSVWEGADMWANPDESSDYIIGLYRRACAHGDRTIAELDLDVIGTVSWWKEGKREATLRRLIIRMIGETARHAGHADIVRELIDGSAGQSRDNTNLPDDQSQQEFVARIEAAAAAFNGT